MSGDYLADSPEHKFEPQDRLPDRCGFVSGGMSCGYGRECHEALWPGEPAESEPDLAAFIAARYDEAEALAKAASSSPAGKWGPRLDDALGGHLLDDAGEVVIYDEGAPSTWQFDHIAANDPAHRLADIKLKRAILARVIAIPHEYVEGDPWYSCRQAVGPRWHVGDSEPEEPNEPGSGCIRDDAGGPCDCGRDGLVETILRQLGTEFDKHPAYKQEWAPE